ncbi:hypothetical protein G7Z17_g10871 [Cylindrodendrum hubeiense]|uniref:Protein kinase domain-containing protein n=1 Tax=Cylindrodendrum hubeiense TaxID=595255 RepID=A0A9P5H536_9HYPO|nr:hypothetical protein G7Z17_g10871 [Cylindrodendrum hubeiense]
MTPMDYNSICNEIYEQILLRLERKDRESLRFAPKGTAEAILQSDVLLQFFHSLLPPRQPEDNTLRLEITGDTFVKRIEDRRLHKFLAVLIFASCPIEATILFVRKLVAQDAWPIISVKGRHLDFLPAHRSDLLDLFDKDGVTVDRVLGKQACFCPVVFHKRDEITVKNPEHYRLPYLEDEVEVGNGSFGRVFRVHIAKGHFYDPSLGIEYPKSIVLARKDYNVSSEYEVRGQGERDIIQKILKSNARDCKNILESFGSIEIGNTYSLLMPFAMCDLRGYMMEHHKSQPSTTEAKAKMVLCAEGLSGGLNFLHTKMQTSDRTEDLVCYHMDLKPSNILVFRDTTHDPEGFIWKLSDFGMSRVKIRRGRSEVEKDFNTWFKLRNDNPESTPSATINRRGEGTYLAPESKLSGPSMKSPSDVWSLGCVLSVLFAYLEEGKAGVESYQRERNNNPKADGIDRFFLRAGNFSPARVHPAISIRHKRLVEAARQRSLEESQIVSHMLTYLETSVFKLEPKDRNDAAQIQAKLLEIFRRYIELQPPPDRSERDASLSSWRDRLVR